MGRGEEQVMLVFALVMLLALILFVLAPAYGFKIRHRPNWQRATFFA